MKPDSAPGRLEADAPGWRPVEPLLVVDAANVVGSRPDGWWRDRAGAAARLRDALAQTARTGLPGLPPPVEVVLVVEGPARGVAAVSGVRVVAAPGSGDDAIVELVRTEASGRVCVVVTADRDLRARVVALGARVHGPRWLRGPETGRPETRGPKTSGLETSGPENGQAGSERPGGMSGPRSG